MGLARSHGVCALLLALTFAIGTTLGGGPVRGTVRCRHCPPGCPMHSGRLGCHHAADTGHHDRREPGLRCACGSHSETPTAPLPVFRAILALRSESRPIVAQSSVTPAVRAFTTQVVLEPPTDPPRASLV